VIAPPHPPRASRGRALKARTASGSTAYEKGPRGHIKGSGPAPRRGPAWTELGIPHPDDPAAGRRGPKPSWLYEFRWQPEGAIRPNNPPRSHADRPAVRAGRPGGRARAGCGGKVPTFRPTPTQPKQLGGPRCTPAWVRFREHGATPAGRSTTQATRETMIWDTPTRGRLRRRRGRARGLGPGGPMTKLHHPELRAAPVHPEALCRLVAEPGDAEHPAQGWPPLPVELQTEDLTVCRGLPGRAPSPWDSGLYRPTSIAPGPSPALFLDPWRAASSAAPSNRTRASTGAFAPRGSASQSSPCGTASAPKEPVAGGAARNAYAGLLWALRECGRAAGSTPAASRSGGDSAGGGPGSRRRWPCNAHDQGGRASGVFQLLVYPMPRRPAPPPRTDHDTRERPLVWTARSNTIGWRSVPRRRAGPGEGRSRPYGRRRPPPTT